MSASDPPPIPPWGEGDPPPPPPAAAVAAVAGSPAPPDPSTWQVPPSRDGTSRRWLWLGALVVVVVAIVVVVVVIVTHKDSPSSASIGPSGSSVPPTDAAIRNWFADASGPQCVAVGPAALQTAESLDGVTAAIECHDGAGIVAIYARLGAASDGASDFARLGTSHRDAVIEPWSSSTGTSGELGEFRSIAFAEPALVWDYSGQPFIAEAFGPTRKALDSWWTAVGRVRH